MRPWIALLPVALVCGIVEPGAASIGFGDVGGNVEGVEEVADQVKAVDDLEEEQDEHRDVATNPPLTIQFPALPPLPPLPSLPSFPSLPNPLLPLRDTITATKTLYAQVTRHITRHPVCMTVYGVKPPCLPAGLHLGHNAANGPDCWKRENSPEEASFWQDDEEEGLYIEPTSVLRIPSATTVPTVPQGEDDTVELEPSREGRYLEFRRNTPVVPATNSADTNGRLLNLAPETHIATQTLWVTKVQKVMDYRVTATLEAKNCVPSDLKIPFCRGPPPYKPPPIYVTTKPPHHPTTKPPHHPTTKPPHHPTTKPPHHPTTKPPHYPTTKPPHYPTTKPPHHPIIIKPPPHITIKPPPHITIKPPQHITIKPPYEQETGYVYTDNTHETYDENESNGEELVASEQGDEEV